MKRKVYLVGAGVGGTQGLTAEAAEVLARCGGVFGEKQLLEILPAGCRKLEQTAPEKIRAYLDSHPEIGEAAAVFMVIPAFTGTLHACGRHWKIPTQYRELPVSVPLRIFVRAWAVAGRMQSCCRQILCRRR